MTSDLPSHSEHSSQSIPPGLTLDRFHGGKFEALQPAEAHHRSGLEAILLASAVADEARVVVDLGAGAGVAGLVVAARLPAARVVLSEREPALCAIARETLACPANAAFANRVSIAETDIGAAEADRVAAGLLRDAADTVILNPPFRPANSGSASPAAGRAGAHVLGEGGYEPWMRAAASALAPSGTVIAIVAADQLPALLAAAAGRFGTLALLPIHPRADRPALRVLLRGTKGGRGPFSVVPGITIHGPTGNAFSPALTAILADGAGLAAVHLAWRPKGAV